MYKQTFQNNNHLYTYNEYCILRDNIRLFNIHMHTITFRRKKTKQLLENKQRSDLMYKQNLAYMHFNRFNSVDRL